MDNSAGGHPSLESNHLDCAGQESSRQEHQSSPVFTCFPKLPTEIQEQIWLYSIQPRFVTIVDFHNHYTGKWFNCGRCLDPVPSLSRINQQSRRIFLREYRLYIPFKRTFQPNGVPFKGNQPCYVNPTTDMIYLTLDHIEYEDGLPQKGEIEEIIVEFCENLKRMMEKEVSEYPEVSRKKWQIRKLSLPLQVMTWFHCYDRLCEPEDPIYGEGWLGFSKDREKRWDRYGIFKPEIFPCLEEVVFLRHDWNPAGSLWLANSTVVIPEAQFELMTWEDMMIFLGQEKGLLVRMTNYIVPGVT